jgi:HEAT repeat protein
MRSALLVPAAALTLFSCGGKLPTVRAQLDSPDASVRITAAKALGEARDPAAVMKLAERLADSVPDVRKECAKALGKIRDARAAEPLAAFYGREKIEDVADAGARALIQLGPAAVKPFIGLLRSVRTSVRAGAARGLGKLGAREAVDPLIRLLDDQNEDVRIAAVFALRQIGDSRGIEAMARKVQDKDEDVESAAEKSLGGEGYQPELNRAKRIIRRVH